MNQSSRIVMMVAMALASAGALAHKGDGGGNSGPGGMSSGPGMNSGPGSFNSGPGSLNSGPGNANRVVTPGEGRAIGAANSGLPVGQGRVTANAAHERNAARQKAKRARQLAMRRDKAEDRLENDHDARRENRRDDRRLENEVERDHGVRREDRRDDDRRLEMRGDRGR